MTAKKQRRGKAALAALMIVMVAVLGTLGYLVLQLLGKLQVNPGNDIPSNHYNLDDEPEDPAYFETLYDITDATNLKNFLFQWWYNGGDDMIRYSKDVVNVLLVGVDDNDGQPGSGRSDTMMLASVNRKTRKITLLSFLRDSYCYFDVNGEARYHRLNSAFYYGGPQGLMQAISRLYKIRIDKFITVDFKSFIPLIDALGGVTVDVTEQEAKYINRTAPSQNRGFPSGEGAHLDGRQALIYSRIRKLDSDIERTNRQQKVLESILQRARGASVVQLYNALDVTLPYVQTNYSRSELLGLIPQAAGWLNFDVVHMSSPVIEGEDSNAIGGTINGMSILIVDYPKAAQQVQLALYGESNINLQDDASRNAYIEELFTGAAQRRSSAYTPQPGAAEGGGEEQTGQPGWHWPGFPWGGGGDSPPAEEPKEETEPEAAFPFWPFN